MSEPVRIALLAAALTLGSCRGGAAPRPPEASAPDVDPAFDDDADARALARDLLALGVVPAVERMPEIEAAHLGRLRLEPALPVHGYRHHLAWIRDALSDIDAVFARLIQAAPRPMRFRTRPDAVRFFRTETRSYPSAYAYDGVIGYNLEGVLHESKETVTATLVHELVHLADQRGDSWWSHDALSEIFESIVADCGDDHDCYGPYAPDDTRVDDGTYYAFDKKTRDVREYAAELGLRWFREHRDPGEVGAPFKCATPLNAVAWRLVADELFGGLDATEACATATATEPEPHTPPPP